MDRHNQESSSPWEPLWPPGYEASPVSSTDSDSDSSSDDFPLARQTARLEEDRLEAARRENARLRATRQQDDYFQDARPQDARPQDARPQDAHQRFVRRQPPVIDSDSSPDDSPLARRAARREMACLEAARRQNARLMSARHQDARPQPARPQPARPQPARQQPARQQPARQQPARQQPARQQSARQQAVRRQEANRQEARLQEARRQQARLQEARHQEATRDEMPNLVRQPNRPPPGFGQGSSSAQVQYGARTMLSMYANQTPSTDNSAGELPVVMPDYHQRPDYAPQDCVNDIRRICTETQARVQALSQAIGRQPGMPGNLTDLLNNDLRVISQQFSSTAYYCRLIEKKLGQSSRENNQSLVDAYERELKEVRHKFQTSQDRIRGLELAIDDFEGSFSIVEKRRKVEVDKKTEKINNQKRRIKEQQGQIDSLKRKLDVKTGRLSTLSSRIHDESSSEPDYSLHSATSEFGGRNSPRVPEPKYSSTLSIKDEEFLMNNLKNLRMENPLSGPGGKVVPPPPSGPSRMQRDNQMNRGVTAPQPNPYGHFGHPMPMGPMGQMPSMGPMGPMDPMHPMNGALAPYNGFPPMGAYGHHGLEYGQGAGPSGQVPPPYPGFGGVPNHQSLAPTSASVPAASHSGPARQRTTTATSNSARGSESNASNALVLRRSDDADIDPETRVWKDLFSKLFTGCFGWAATHCKDGLPGAIEAAVKANPKLWDYIVKVATCYKDPQAAPGHATFMLASAEHRLHFIARLLLQYMEQEMLHWRFWLGWDEEVDVELRRIGPVLDYIGYPLDARREARQRLRNIVESIVRDEEYPRFRKYKTTQHAHRLQDIAGPFFCDGSNSTTTNTANKGNNNNGGAQKKSSTPLSHDAVLGLHSMVNMGMELSNKMMTSRLSFAFTWNECAVKFCHDSHMALNSTLSGISLQHKHTRIALVVSPSVSYRDDSGPSIVPRGVMKAQVLVMN